MRRLLRRTRRRPTTPPCQEGSAFQNKARACLALFFILAGIYALRSFIPALLWGGIFAVCLWPLYAMAERRFGQHLWLPIMFTIVLTLVFLVPLTFLGYKLIDEIQSGVAWLKSVKLSGLPMPSWLGKLPFGASAATRWWQTYLAHPDKLSQLLQTVNVGHGFRMTRQVGSEVIHRCVVFVFSLLTLFFTLKDGDAIISRCLRGSHRLFGPQGKTMARQIISSIHGTLAGLVLVGLGEGAILGVAYIVSGAPQPLLLALGTALAAMVPMAGWVAMTIVCILIQAKGHLVAAVATWLFGGVILFLADHFVRPVLIGGTTKVPFLWVLLGILGGAETWGLLGLFLGPAIMAVLHLLWLRWTDARPDGLGKQPQPPKAPVKPPLPLSVLKKPATKESAKPVTPT
ncbi:AI-2E family transporter [Formicincola oecophyllae]|uniref:AI-2E family transporter n=1 Tax=Formicincola oecophyllae TaxID=2558361 RepID=A0A4Y6U6K5_9PROT|nr:AI-2E family transporter [Formicincola oecophyllae]QDH12982.1 AI-2E family transporter [Formicincola oecophyllae]